LNALIFDGDFRRKSHHKVVVAYDGFTNAGGPQTQEAIYDSLVQCEVGPTSLCNSAGGSFGE
tara:strand:- start:420 stop:605 length:186 start_codon:yes stop_codon:yes gene_type:complete